MLRIAHFHICGSSQAAFGRHLRPVHTVSVSSAVKECEKQLRAAHVPEACLSSRYLMAHVLGQRTLSNLQAVGNRRLSNDELQRYQEMSKKRLQRMPVQYVLEEWDFRRLTLKLKPPVLIPRPETEDLVGNVIDEVQMRLRKEGMFETEVAVDNKKACLRCLDIGCGSGAIALALLDECPQIEMTAVDINPQAITLTEQNAQRLKLSDRLQVHLCSAGSCSFLGDSLFDIVVSNPPYIATKQLNDLEPEVALFEDREALDGGEDGLHVVKEVVESAASLLKQNGSLWLEVDDYQPSLLRQWLSTTDLEMLWIDSQKDFMGKERFCLMKKR